jgi:protoporphyrinogen/coproporphyrinogen III oxidase
MMPQKVAVIGGGIAGLAAASRLRALAAESGDPVELHLFEASVRTGGCIETATGNGFVMELGPDSIVTDKPAGMTLVRRLGLEDDVVAIQPEFRGARVVRGRRLVPIPDDFRFFTPTSLVSLVTTRLFSPAGILRAAMEPLVPARRTAVDESLASFVTRRFGREVLDRLAQPLIGGIYSGDPKRLSMRATMPQFLEIERRHGSLVHAMRKMRLEARAQPASGPRMVSLRNGLSEIVASLSAQLHGAIHTAAPVSNLRYTPDRTRPWSIELGAASVDADAVICTTPAHETARLLEKIDAPLAEMLREIPYHSVATITLAFRSSELPPLPRCTGFVVPDVEKRNIIAATIATQKYPHRAPEGSTLIRAFSGGALRPLPSRVDDAQLTAWAQSDLRDLLHIEAVPEFAIVRRWPRSMPEYALGHVELAGEITLRAGALPGLALAGSAYSGVGIPDCIRSGEQAAEYVLRQAQNDTGYAGRANSR